MVRRQPRRGRWIRWLVGVAVVVVVVVVGGPFVYIHFIEGKAPAPLKLGPPTTVVGQTGSTSVAANASTDAVNGTWNISTGSLW